MKRFLAVLALSLFLIPLGCENRVTDPEAGPQASPPPPSFAGNKGGIVYTERSSAGTDLIYLNLTTNKTTLLTTNPGPDQMASWSPDGNWIVFSSAVPLSNDMDLHVMSVAKDGAPGVPYTILSGHKGHDTYPAWSPDGNKIAFRCNRGDICYIEMDWTVGVPLPASAPDTLTLKAVGGPPYFDGRPSWSPNSKEIIFARNCVKPSCPIADKQRDLWKVGLKGVETRITFTQDIKEDNPSWNPSPPAGVQEIVYNVIADVGGFGETNYIFLDSIPASLPITGSGTQLTTGGQEDYPWFTPTGVQVFYLSGTDETSWDVFLMDSNGTKQKNVTKNISGNQLFGAPRPIPGVTKY